MQRTGFALLASEPHTLGEAGGAPPAGGPVSRPLPGKASAAAPAAKLGRASSLRPRPASSCWPSRTRRSPAGASGDRLVAQQALREHPLIHGRGISTWLENSWEFTGECRQLNPPSASARGQASLPRAVLESPYPRGLLLLSHAFAAGAARKAEACRPARSRRGRPLPSRGVWPAAGARTPQGNWGRAVVSGCGHSPVTGSREHGLPRPPTPVSWRFLLRPGQGPLGWRWPGA